MSTRAGLNEATSGASDPMQVMQRVVDQVLVLIAAADGALIALLGQGDVLDYVCGSGYLTPHVGFTLGVEGSLSGVAVRTGRIVHTEDTAVDPRVNAEACRRLNVGSTVCVPLLRGDQAFGVLNVSSSRRQAFGDSDTALLGGLAEFVSTVVDSAQGFEGTTGVLPAASSVGDGGLPLDADGGLRDEQKQGRFVTGVLNPQVAEQSASRQRIAGVLDRSAFSMVFQPMIRLEDETVAAYEALARFSGEPIRTPDAWFAEAHAAGLGIELELAALELALNCQSALPEGAVLSVNAGPNAATSPKLVELLGGADATRVIVELTEHVSVADYPYLVDALGELRATGARLAIDDTGAGMSSLAHILELSPDFIKLDRVLTTGIDRDPVRRALAASLVQFAADTGAVIVAEGIETADELRVLRDLGISHGQGYHLGYPVPLAGLS